MSRCGRTFYESPALIGCALAVGRELYDDLRGFDPHMLVWGVEDLDFGLKCWLLGHPILHDPEVIVGHRFRQSFDNYEVPYERLLTNQVRLARKNFTPGVWRQWLERCRLRSPQKLSDHPEGLWAYVWQLFQEHQESVESERAYLQARRVRDEFWYAERFGLNWPRLEIAPRPTVRASALLQDLEEWTVEASPSPPPTPSIEIQRDEDGGAEEYKPLDNDQSVTGKKLRDAIVGQKMNLKCVVVPPEGRTVTGYLWDVPGVTFKNWRAHQTKGEWFPIVVDEDLVDQTAHFYWSEAGDHAVKVTVTLDDESTMSKTETLNIVAPTVTFGEVGDLGKTAVGSNIIGVTEVPSIGLFSTGGTRVGHPNPGGSPSIGGIGYGILWTGKVEMPVGWPRSTGKWNWVQLITLDSYRVVSSVQRKANANGTEFLDSSYPYEPEPYPATFGDAAGAYATGDDAADIHKDIDTPSTWETPDTTEMRIGNGRFRIWIMFLPPGDTSRYVPTKMIHWQWGGKTVKVGGTWGAATEAHQYRSTSIDTQEFPVWNDNYTNHTGYQGNEDVQLAVAFMVDDVTAGDGTISGQATVSVPIDVKEELVIRLSSSNPNRLTVPETVTIPAEASSVGFSFTVADEVDGDATVIVFAQAKNHTTGSDSILVKAKNSE